MLAAVVAELTVHLVGEEEEIVLLDDVTQLFQLPVAEKMRIYSQMNKEGNGEYKEKRDECP